MSTSTLPPVQLEPSQVDAEPSETFGTGDRVKIDGPPTTWRVFASHVPVDESRPTVHFCTVHTADDRAVGVAAFMEGDSSVKLLTRGVASILDFFFDGEPDTHVTRPIMPITQFLRLYPEFAYVVQPVVDGMAKQGWME